MTHETEYARALAHLTDTYKALGCGTEDADERAKDFMHRLTAAGWKCHRPTEPVEPQTGPKAERPQAWDEARRALKGMTTDTEEN